MHACSACAGGTKVRSYACPGQVQWGMKSVPGPQLARALSLRLGWGVLALGLWPLPPFYPVPQAAIYAASIADRAPNPSLNDAAPAGPTDAGAAPGGQ